MLNELIELRQYLCELPPVTERLKYANLSAEIGKNEREGVINAITRPLTVIARAVLYAYPEVIALPLRLKMAECAMKAWLGAERDATLYPVNNNRTPLEDSQESEKKPLIEIVEHTLREKYNINGTLEGWLPTYCIKSILRPNISNLADRLEDARENLNEEQGKVIRELKLLLNRITHTIDSTKGADAKTLAKFSDLLTEFMGRHGTILLQLENQNGKQLVQEELYIVPVQKALKLPQRLAEKRNDYNFRTFTRGVNPNEVMRNTFNQITYERILADAL